MTTKVFFCYINSEVNIAKDVCNDLEKEGIKIDLDAPTTESSEDDYMKKIEDSDFVMVLASEDARNDQQVLAWIKYANDLNKRIVPICYRSTSGLSSWVKNEWGVDTPVYTFGNIDSREDLYCLLKEWLGLPLEKDVYVIRKRLRVLNPQVESLQIREREGKTLKFVPFLKLVLSCLWDATVAFANLVGVVIIGAFSGGCFGIAILFFALSFCGTLIAKYPVISFLTIFTVVAIYITNVARKNYEKIVTEEYIKVKDELRLKTSERNSLMKKLDSLEKGLSLPKENRNVLTNSGMDIMNNELSKTKKELLGGVIALLQSRRK